MHGLPHGLVVQAVIVSFKETLSTLEKLNVNAWL
jgi:hypothetical protein